ncbi:unnamed protein product [Acanthoscelides obtectus]|uniref:Uncharacterized protein n=1 Tax=Acanthoscelides obtectus TaxID=200917 RepID=A0A9P0KMG2_ACAOB|nr:unnamed protein product [Acanthoscelides obtectus]CAK1682102.1 hypothetical protein AOBTE_LOCUS33427 [Acanthoscelides obtectus]
MHVERERRCQMSILCCLTIVHQRHQCFRKPFIGNIHSWPQLILPRWFIRDIPELYASRSLTSIYRVDIHNRFKWLYVRRPVNMEIQHHSSIQV